MTKISQLSSIGDSLAIDDQFLIRDVSDAVTPNKSVTVSGITRGLADGDALAPAIAFAADKDTGIYRSGTNALAISTNGTGRLFVDSSGNVKVSTGEIFQTSATSYIRIDGGSGSGTGANIIAFGESHASAPGRISLSAVGTGAIIASTGGAERMRL
ncbi:MAG: hypothetical protein EBZ61_07360, partial [Micrococcales bacterium]|nr:hypothetical protein [Micrococcales bacterium]